MKHLLFITAFMIGTMSCWAQGKDHAVTHSRQSNSDNVVSGSRAYEIIVTRVDTEDEVKTRNSAIRGLMQEQNSRGFFDSALGAALKTGYGSLATQKAVNLT